MDDVCVHEENCRMELLLKVVYKCIQIQRSRKTFTPATASFLDRFFIGLHVFIRNLIHAPNFCDHKKTQHSRLLDTWKGATCRF